MKRNRSLLWMIILILLALLCYCRYCSPPQQDCPDCTPPTPKYSVYPEMLVIEPDTTLNADSLELEVIAINSNDTLFPLSVIPVDTTIYINYDMSNPVHVEMVYFPNENAQEDYCPHQADIQYDGGPILDVIIMREISPVCSNQPPNWLPLSPTIPINFPNYSNSTGDIFYLKVNNSEIIALHSDVLGEMKVEKCLGSQYTITPHSTLPNIVQVTGASSSYSFNIEVYSTGVNADIFITNPVSATFLYEFN